MKKLIPLAAAALFALAAVPAVTPAAPVVVGAHQEYEEIVVGPYEHEHRAHEEAHHLRDRGFHTEVFFVPGQGWQVKAWRH